MHSTYEDAVILQSSNLKTYLDYAHQLILRHHTSWCGIITLFFISYFCFLFFVCCFLLVGYFQLGFYFDFRISSGSKYYHAEHACISFHYLFLGWLMQCLPFSFAFLFLSFSFFFLFDKSDILGNF